MSDEEHHFESKGDAGASKTYPQQAGTIRKNGYIVIKNRPCKVFSFFNLSTNWGFYFDWILYLVWLDFLWVSLDVSRSVDLLILHGYGWIFMDYYYHPTPCGSSTIIGILLVLIETFCGLLLFVIDLLICCFFFMSLVEFLWVFIVIWVLVRFFGCILDLLM